MFILLLHYKKRLKRLLKILKLTVHIWINIIKQVNLSVPVREIPGPEDVSFAMDYPEQR